MLQESYFKKPCWYPTSTKQTFQKFWITAVCLFSLRNIQYQKTLNGNESQDAQLIFQKAKQSYRKLVSINSILWRLYGLHFRVVSLF